MTWPHDDCTSPLGPVSSGYHEGGSSYFKNATDARWDRMGIKNEYFEIGGLGRVSGGLELFDSTLQVRGVSNHINNNEVNASAHRIQSRG
jgi:hypothetical protein